MDDRISKGTQTATKGWIAYLDVYGFSSLIGDQDNSEVADKLLKVHRDSQASLALVDHHQFFSDSIFVYSHHKEADGGSESAFESVAAAVRTLIKHSFSVNLFMRGSLAYGSLNILPNIILGKPLIRAYNQEQALQYPIVVVPEIELEMGGISFALPVVEVETKLGLVSAAVIFPHSRSPLFDAAAQKAREAAKIGPDHVALAWKRYLELLQRLGFGENGRKAGD